MSPDDITERQELMVKVMKIFDDYCNDNDYCNDKDNNVSVELALYLDVLGNCIGYLIHNGIQQENRDMILNSLVMGIKRSMMINKDSFKDLENGL